MGRRLVVLLVALVIGGCGDSGSPAFHGGASDVPCTGEGVKRCFELTVTNAGDGAGDGSCWVSLLDGSGREIASSSRLLLRGVEQEEHVTGAVAVVTTLEVDGFDFEVRCEPAPEG